MRIDRVKLAMALAQRDLNCKQLCERINVSRTTVSAIKAGKSCRKDTAEKLAAGLGVSVEDLTEGR